MSTILFGILVLAGISANPVHNSSTGAGNSSYFPVVASRQDCPDVYANFCYHGTCRFHLSEKEAYCVCFKGYVGVRCEHMDLLQVMTTDPPPLLVVVLSMTLLAIVTVIGSLAIHLCKRRRKKNGPNLLGKKMNLMI
ncbi:protransforming growth factor alpha-like isoform X1 [Pyxicephalus adspersus]|uniref:protransforming growth factor alpha-like isoform X1 n=1 Tax=Pyxicephalus adspersus TaxID=30357 RepID=UPI003B5B3803